MPNHVSNTFSVVGLNEQETKEMATAFAENRLLQTYVPAPSDEELPYSCGSLHNTREEALKWASTEAPWWNDRDEEGRKRWLSQFPTTEEREERLSKFGVVSGYAWCNKHWGSKWGVYDAVVDCLTKNADGVLTGFDGRFLSAWCSPLEGLCALSALFPSATITITFLEEGNDFMGAAAFRDGEMKEMCDETPSSHFEEWAHMEKSEMFDAYQKAINDENDDEEWNLRDELMDEYLNSDAREAYLSDMETLANEELEAVLA